MFEKLNLPDLDRGIDLIAQSFDGDYWSIQCKYKEDDRKKKAVSENI